jgi:hypothetical protein
MCVYNHFGKFHFPFIISRTVKFMGKFTGIKIVLFFSTLCLETLYAGDVHRDPYRSACIVFMSLVQS